MRRKLWTILAALLACAPLARPPLARADQPAPAPASAPSSPEARQAEEQAAFKAALAAGVHGPADAPLLDEGRLRVPAGVVFAPVPSAARLMRALGNVPTDTLVGLLFDEKRPEWIGVVDYVREGHVKDDEAKDFDPDDILASLREGTEEANKDRAARGFAELEIVGWLQTPQYDPATHRLTWAMKVRDKGDADPDVDVNYNTRLLGRDGYFVLNMLTDSDRFARDKPLAISLLGGIGYAKGKTYEDFDSSTDRVAEYGLAALIGVVAAKKLGLLAVAGLFLLKFAKIGAIAVAGGAAAFSRIFRRKKKAGA